MKRLAFLLGTVFGAGLLPKAPGTFGALAAMPFLIPLAWVSLPIYLAITVVVFAIGTWAAHMIQVEHPDDDPQIVVIDEFVGILVTFIAVPINAWTMVFGLVLFRVFDIWKPFPVGWLDKHVKGGWGIMLDDVAAGALALIVLQVGVAIT